jgi:hypothetical protein
LVTNCDQHHYATSVNDDQARILGVIWSYKNKSRRRVSNLLNPPPGRVSSIRGMVSASLNRLDESLGKYAANEFHGILTTTLQ